MCGIVGVANFDREQVVDQTKFNVMTDSLAHRGPDDRGIYFGKNVALGFRRLAILDLSDAGHQPMADASEQFWMVFNGEIYNYLLLKEELLAKGYTFKSRTDAEVVVNLFKEEGLGFLNRMDGMFALAIWDGLRRELFLARDRAGIKPLFYTNSGKYLLFASEIQPLLNYDHKLKEVNYEKLGEHLMFRSICGGGTLFKHIFELLPGHVLKYSSLGGIEIRQYWDYLFAEEKHNNGTNDNEATEAIEKTLSSAVKSHLASDVPVGVQLSGGVDSGLITALTRVHKSDTLNTFSIDVDDPEYSESRYSQLIAEKYNTVHHKLIFSEGDFFKAFNSIREHFAEPINHPNHVALYYLSKYAKRYVSVMLTGEGADEMFCGYSRFARLSRFLRIAAYIPAPSKCILTNILNRLPFERFRLFSEFITKDFKDFITTANSFVKEDGIKKIYGRTPELEIRTNLLEKCDADSIFRNSYYEMKTYLPPILKRQDHASMLASIEARVPFLDNNMLRICAALPSKWKVHRGCCKYIVKRIAEKYIPKENIYRAKMGFGMPLGKWLCNRKLLGGYVDILRSRNFYKRNLFNRNVIDKIMSGNNGSKWVNTELLWIMINLELWFQRHIDIN